VASTARKRRSGGGATVTYVLSQDGSVAFTVERRLTGHKHGKRCSPGRKTGKRCSFVRTVPGSFTVPGKAGSNSFKFSGRLGNKKLPPGRYRLVGTPLDAGGNRGAAVRASFKIVQKPRAH
jgi:hypothetical protein